MSARGGWNAARSAWAVVTARDGGCAGRCEPFGDGHRGGRDPSLFLAPRETRADPLLAAAEEDGLGAAALAAFIDHLEQGVVVTDATGRGLILNRAARLLLSRGPVRLREGRLQAADPRETAALRRLIERCATGSGRSGAVRLAEDEPGGPIMALATPLRLPSAGVDEVGLVAVLLVEPFRPRGADAAILREQFDLTPAEAALAAEVLHGDGLPACARRLGIRTSTARTHLQRVFEKTGTRRQAELVRLLLLCRHAVEEVGSRREST